MRGRANPKHKKHKKQSLEDYPVTFAVSRGQSLADMIDLAVSILNTTAGAEGFNLHVVEKQSKDGLVDSAALSKMDLSREHIELTYILSRKSGLNGL